MKKEFTHSQKYDTSSIDTSQVDAYEMLKGQHKYDQSKQENISDQKVS